MSAEYNPDAYMAGHYAKVADVRTDFRNYNLFTLISTLVRGKTALDIGCGLGWLVGMLRERGIDASGLEPSEHMRALAAEVNPGTPIIAGTAEGADALVTNPVDSVLMIDVLEHIEDDAAQVRRVHRMLAPGGQFVVVVPAYQALFGERDRQMGHYRRYSLGGLRALLEANGFSVERLRYWNALAVLPYFVAEKVLRRPLKASLREGGKSAAARLLHRAVNFWLGRIERYADFGFGLTIIGTATKR